MIGYRFKIAVLERFLIAPVALIGADPKAEIALRARELRPTHGFCF